MLLSEGGKTLDPRHHVFGGVFDVEVAAVVVVSNDGIHGCAGRHNDPTPVRDIKEVAGGYLELGIVDLVYQIDVGQLRLHAASGGVHEAHRRCFGFVNRHVAGKRHIDGKY